MPPTTTDQPRPHGPRLGLDAPLPPAEAFTPGLALFSPAEHGGGFASAPLPCHPAEVSMLPTGPDAGVERSLPVICRRCERTYELRHELTAGRAWLVFSPVPLRARLSVGPDGWPS